MTALVDDMGCESFSSVGNWRFPFADVSVVVKTAEDAVDGRTGSDWVTTFPLNGSDQIKIISFCPFIETSLHHF